LRIILQECDFVDTPGSGIQGAYLSGIVIARRESIVASSKRLDGVEGDNRRDAPSPPPDLLTEGRRRPSRGEDKEADALARTLTA